MNGTGTIPPLSAASILGRGTVNRQIRWSVLLMSGSMLNTKQVGRRNPRVFGYGGQWGPPQGGDAWACNTFLWWVAVMLKWQIAVTGRVSRSPVVRTFSFVHLYGSHFSLPLLSPFLSLVLPASYYWAELNYPTESFHQRGSSIGVSL